MSYGQHPDPNTPPPYGAPLQGPGSQPPGYGGQGQYDQAGYAQQPSYGQPPPYGQPGQYGYGGTQWNGTMPRPGSVTSGSVLAIIGGIIAVLIGGLFLIVAGIEDADEVLAQAGFPSSWFVTIGAVVVAVGLVVLVLGILALRGQWWAAIALAVVGALYILLAIWSMIQGQSGVLVGMIWIALSVGLLMSRTSRAWFQAQR